MLDLRSEDIPEEGYIIRPMLFHAVVDLWADIWPLLEPAIERSGGRLSGQVVLDALCGDEMQCWCIVDRNENISAAIITEIVYYRTGMRAVNYLLCGGKDVKGWKHLLRAIDAWAREVGCTEIEFGGRFGWQPAMEEIGFERRGVWMSRSLMTDA